MSGRLRTLIGEVVGYHSGRRDPMTPSEVQHARSLKARYGCGWQTVADMVGRNEVDIRRYCDPAFMLAAAASARPPAATPRAGASTPDWRTGSTRKGEPAPAPKSPIRSVRPDEIEGGAAVLQAMRAASALPGFCARPASIIADHAGMTPPKTGVVLRGLRLIAPAVVEALGEAGNSRTWRLTDAGLAWCKGERS
jgi:hypothetical protein